MKSNSKPYGIRGELSQTAIFKDFKEEWSQDGIDFLVENSCIAMSFTDPDKDKLAVDIANNYVRVWAFTHNCPLNINYNVTWKPNAKGRATSLDLEDRVGLAEVITTVSSDRNMTVTGTSSSISFADNKDLTMKAYSNPILQKAMKYYSEEVVGSKHPLYGIYKALETILVELGKGKQKKGIEKLSRLLGESNRYIEDIKQTTQVTRHGVTNAKVKLSEKECKNRVKSIIMRYATTLPTNSK